MKKILSYIFVFIVGLSTANAQGVAGLNLEFKIGTAGDKMNQESTYASFETSYLVEHGLSIAVGESYQFFFTTKAGLKIGALYEYSRHSKIEQYHYILFFNQIKRSGDITRKYINQSVLLPFQFLWQERKIGFSTGIITNFHLSADLEQEHVFFEDGAEISRSTRNHRSGGVTGDSFGDWEKTDLERQFSFQWTLGLYFIISPKVSIDVAYKNFINQNLLEVEVKNFDVSDTFKRTYDPLAHSLTVGINWRIK